MNRELIRCPVYRGKLMKDLPPVEDIEAEGSHLLEHSLVQIWTHLTPAHGQD